MGFPKIIVHIASAFLVSVASCSYADPGPGDVSSSWEKAIVHVPGNFFTTTVSAVEVERPYPVVVLMHGCNGVSSVRDWAAFLKDNGYVVVLPDSFARERPASCDPASKRAGLFADVRNFRTDELRYALEQLGKIPWADKRNLFLMGHSEGGAIAARSGAALREGGLRFRGVIVSGWLCVARNYPPYDGIHIPDESALLVLNHERDPWYSWANGRQCSEFFGNRKNATEVVLPGTDHNTFEPPAKEAVLKFLQNSLVQ